MRYVLWPLGVLVFLGLTVNIKFLMFLWPIALSIYLGVEVLKALAGF